VCVDLCVMVVMSEALNPMLPCLSGVPPEDVGATFGDSSNWCLRPDGLGTLPGWPTPCFSRREAWAGTLTLVCFISVSRGWLERMMV
jgi:hypothetical protein